MAVSTVPQLQFENPTTLKASVLFLKKLTGVAISTIVYCRNLFNEREFVDKQFEGLAIKLVKANAKNAAGSNAHCLSKWIEGAFDALERRYLRELILEIRDVNDQSVLETYGFKFVYKEDVSEKSLEKCDEIIPPTSCLDNDNKQMVRKLLRNIMIMTSGLENLPDRCQTTVKITYYDDVTPPDYEPPGFKPLTENIPCFKKESYSTYRCGKIDTAFHGMTLSTKVAAEEKATSNIPLKESSQSDKPEDSLYCQVLSECSKMSSISLTKLMKQFDLELSTSMLVLKQLLKDGALKKSTHQPSIEKPDIMFSVDKKFLLKELGERKREDEENERSSKSDFQISKQVKLK